MLLAERDDDPITAIIPIINNGWTKAMKFLVPNFVLIFPIPKAGFIMFTYITINKPNKKIVLIKSVS